MSSSVSFLRGVPQRLLREPLAHFFVLGVLLFVAHALVATDPRTISVTPGLKAELRRRFQDQNGRKPEPAEFEAALREWQRDEALYREALRERLDRDDPSVRTALVEKMRSRAAFEVPKRDPSEAELEAWLSSHRSSYEVPQRYDFEFLAIPKSEPDAAERIAKLESALAGGATPATLGRPLIGGNLSLADLKQRIEPELAERITALAAGPWQRVETAENLALARVKGVEGGLPKLDEIRARVVADWSFAARKDAIERVVQRTVDLYRVEERP
ncbi:MAG: peptidyl-prolyl cis-trans isomerase [Myxococcota bacterium]